jgi:hypothetical protein
LKPVGKLVFVRAGEREMEDGEEEESAGKKGRVAGRRSVRHTVGMREPFPLSLSQGGRPPTKKKHDAPLMTNTAYMHSIQWRFSIARVSRRKMSVFCDSGMMPCDSAERRAWGGR